MVSSREECFYHSCRRRNKLSKCHYCKKFFCYEHKIPFSTRIPGIGIHNKEGHGCIPYTMGVEPPKPPITIRPPPPIEDPFPEPVSPPLPKPIVNYKRLFKIIIVMLVLIVIFYFLFNLLLFSENSQNQFESKNMTVPLFDKFNSFREQKNLHDITYDSDAYNMALYLAETFYNSNNYFMFSDDLNKVSLDYKMSNVEILTTKLDNLDETQFDFMFNSWTDKEIFSKKILNSSFTNGALGCYKESCVLVLGVEKVKFAPTKSSVNSEVITNEISDFWGFFEINIESLEIKIHDLINEERINNGLSPLTFDSALTEIARKHSIDMATNNFFEHDNLNGQDPTNRAKLSGYNCYKDYGSYYTEGIAENIALTPKGNVVGCGNVYSEEDIAKCTVDGWMQSSGHRKNILTSSYDKEGIGVAFSSDDKFYITEDFC